MGSSNREEQERVRNLLLDTVTLLCKNGLSFKKQLKVQGLLGITMDENDVFIVHINEQVGEISVEHHKKDSDKKNADIPDDCSENSIESWRSKDSTPSKAHTDKISHRKRTSTSSPIFKGPPEKVKIKTEKQDESACDLIFVGEEDDKSRIPKLPMMQGNAGYGAVPPMGAGPPGTFNQFSSNIQGNVQPGPFITGIVPNPQHSQDNTDKSYGSGMMLGTASASVWYTQRRSRTGPDKKHVCPVEGCDKAYYDKRNLLRHRKEKHSVNKEPDHITENVPDDDNQAKDYAADISQAQDLIAQSNRVSDLNEISEFISATNNVPDFSISELDDLNVNQNNANPPSEIDEKCVENSSCEMLVSRDIDSDGLALDESDNEIC